MDKGKKRERNVNFSREETEKLVLLVEAYKKIIENKKSDAVTWQEKEQAWKAIETEFNSSAAAAYRDAKHLKLKYEALKRDTRKKCSVIREGYEAGGVNEVSPLTPVEQKVREMISLSVEGVEADQLEAAAREESDKVFLAETIIQPSNLEGSMSDNDTAKFSDSNNLIIDISENLPNKRHLGYDESLAVPQKKWISLKSKSKKHPAWCNSKEKRPFDKLAEGKFEIVELQKKLIEEEVEEKMLKKQMMKDEIRHKNELHKLEKEQMLLKIAILKTELENKNK